jgi:hypothetical protein
MRSKGSTPLSPRKHTIVNKSHRNLVQKSRQLGKCRCREENTTHTKVDTISMRVDERKLIFDKWERRREGEGRREKERSKPFRVPSEESRKRPFG